MKAIKALLSMIFFICCVHSFVTYAAANAPKEGIKSTVDAVLEVLRDKKLSLPDNKEERRARISALIKDRFDFKEMAKRSLARHWKERTPEEAQEFIAVFSDLLIASYIGKIEDYTDEKVTYDKDVIKGKGKYGVVNTTIIAKDVDIPIDYKVVLRDGKWWVYDVVAEGVSFISTYRGQYNRVIVKESYAQLIQRMKKKLDEVNAM